MLTALIFGIGTALPIIIGAAIGTRWSLPPALLAALMSFGGGALIAAVAVELFEPAFEQGGPAVAGAALMAGAAVYIALDRLIETKLGEQAFGPGLLLGILLDGLPENAALGLSVAEGGSMVLLAAIIVGNLPEAISGANLMRRDNDIRPKIIMFAWTVTAIGLAVVTVGGYLLSGVMPETGVSVVEAFAGGAALAMLANTLMPAAYREGGWWVGIATAAGFLLAFTLQ